MFPAPSRKLPNKSSKPTSVLHLKDNRFCIMDIDWSKIFFSETFSKRLDAMAKRSIADRSEEAVTFVFNKLSEENWKKCREYKGNSAPESFLSTVSTRLIIDFCRELEGRRRPPKWLERKGELWLKIWRELCLERNDSEWVIQRYTESGFRDRHNVRAIIDLIRAKLPWCGLSNRPESIDGENFHLDEELACDVIDPLVEADNEQNFLFAHYILLDDNESDPWADTAPNSILKAVKSVQLTPKEKILLKLYFCEGYSYASIARHQKIATHLVVRLIKKILDKLRVQLENIPTKPPT